ncbi:hypothetical protein J2X31_003536 [Flavobacterium arsenatis]|uniref:Lipoprotein n=1 Tax=Flavobacterium arsenatis TaxID=1484332 RepID=A0ABU1TUF5_9FLAO|nr:hypothetical protein [Flavobacterium arsenatis]MDR6969503.1 hypothetical protein [Flavobacterium arsenatis]
MKKTLIAVITLVTLQGCTPFKPALSEGNTTNFEELSVKGRQGILINQKLEFGNFQTSKVKRSWTKGGNSRTGISKGVPGDVFYENIISKEFINRNQTFYFQLKDNENRISDVYAASAFNSANLLIGNNPNSIINVFEDIINIENNTESLFYLQVFINNETKPWQLILDNQASQLHADNYTGVFALDENKYYTLKPITKVASKNGHRSIMFGSVGYEIFDANKKSVAAVSLMDRGMVFLKTTDSNEKFLLSNLCSALLLQEQIEN